MLVIVREPEPSALERRVLEQLPQEVNQLVLGDPDIVANWGLAAPAVVFPLVVASGVFVALYAEERIQQQGQAHHKQAEHRIQTQPQGQAERRQAQQRERQQQEQQGEQQKEQQTNSRSLSWSVNEDEPAARLGETAVGAAVQTLVRMRSALMIQGKLR